MKTVKTVTNTVNLSIKKISTFFKQVTCSHDWAYLRTIDSNPIDICSKCNSKRKRRGGK